LTDTTKIEGSFSSAITSRAKASVSRPWVPLPIAIAVGWNFRHSAASTRLAWAIA